MHKMKRAADSRPPSIYDVRNFLICSIYVIDTCAFLIGRIITEQIEVIKTVNH